MLRCAWKPGDSSSADYFEGIFRYPSSLAPFQAPAGVEIRFLPARSRLTVPFRTSRGAFCTWCFFLQDLVDVSTPLNK